MFEKNNLKIYNGDNMELMKNYSDDYFDLAIVDPPYGIGISGQKKSISKNPKHNRKHHEEKNWDNEIPNQNYFNELFRVSKNQIIWGGNYYANYLPNQRDWIVWDKMQGDLGFSMHELAYTSFEKVPKIVRIQTLRGHIKRIHPCEKPIRLYEWILVNYAKEGDKILDTQVGS